MFQAGLNVKVEVGGEVLVATTTTAKRIGNRTVNRSERLIVKVGATGVEGRINTQV